MKRITAVIAVALLLAISFSPCAFAAPSTGSITLNLINRADKNPLAGKTVKAVKVADGSYTPGRAPEFTLTGEFASSGVDISSSEAAAELYGIAAASSSEAAEVKSNSEGEAKFENCALGVYLVYSPDNIFNPFLVFVPLRSDDGVAFDVTAEPKIDIPTESDSTKPDTTKPDVTTPTRYPGEPVTHVTPPTVPATTPGVIPPIVVPTRPDSSVTSPNSPTKPNTPDNPENTSSPEGTTKGEKLPQTGMLQYPIPILSVAGMLMFITGFVVYGESRKKEN